MDMPDPVNVLVYALLGRVMFPRHVGEPSADNPDWFPKPTDIEFKTPLL